MSLDANGGSKEPVGYCRPPRATSWKPGQSGNPAGRRKKVREVKALGEMAMEHLAQPIALKIGGKTHEVPKLDALILHGTNLALKSQRPNDITRYIAAITKAGFQYPYAAGAARAEQRELYEQRIAELESQLGAMHVEFRTQQILLRQLLAERKEAKRTKAAGGRRRASNTPPSSDPPTS